MMEFPREKAIPLLKGFERMVGADRRYELGISPREPLFHAFAKLVCELSAQLMTVGTLVKALTYSFSIVSLMLYRMCGSKVRHSSEDSEDGLT